MEASLPCLLLILSAAAAATAEPPPLQNTDGNEIHSRAPYYMVPTDASGVGLAPIGDNPCPYSVIQLKSGGVPVTFHPTNPKADVVRESTDLNIRFDADADAAPCNFSTVWQVDNDNEDDEPTGRYFVKAGGDLGKPGIGTFNSWFKVEPIEGNGREAQVYKLVFCPSVCDICTVKCKDVGLFDEEDKRRLGLVVDGDRRPFAVSFVKWKADDHVELRREEGTYMA